MLRAEERARAQEHRSHVVARRGDPGLVRRGREHLRGEGAQRRAFEAEGREHEGQATRRARASKVDLQILTRRDHVVRESSQARGVGIERDAQLVAVGRRGPHLERGRGRRTSTAVRAIAHVQPRRHGQERRSVAVRRGLDRASVGEAQAHGHARGGLPIAAPDSNEHVASELRRERRALEGGAGANGLYRQQHVCLSHGAAETGARGADAERHLPTAVKARGRKPTQLGASACVRAPKVLFTGRAVHGDLHAGQGSSVRASHEDVYCEP